MAEAKPPRRSNRREPIPSRKLPGPVDGGFHQPFGLTLLRAPGELYDRRVGRERSQLRSIPSSVVIPQTRKRWGSPFGPFPTGQTGGNETVILTLQPSDL